MHFYFCVVCACVLACLYVYHTYAVHTEAMNVLRVLDPPELKIRYKSLHRCTLQGFYVNDSVHSLLHCVAGVLFGFQILPLKEAYIEQGNTDKPQGNKDKLYT